MKPIPSPRSLPGVGTLLSIIAAGGPKKLHLYVDKRHRQLGPIFREKMGPVSAVFLSDGNYMRKIFSLEGKHPRHFIPDAWLKYNEIYGRKRGLLFMEGEEWLKVRKEMNKVLLKVDRNKFIEPATIAADNLIVNLQSTPVVSNLEKQLYKWSLEVIMATLSGSNTYMKCKSNLSQEMDQLANTLHQIFIETASLSLIPIQIAIKLKLPVWKRFVWASDLIIDQGKKMVEKVLRESTNSNGEGLLSEMLSTDMTEEDVYRIAVDLILGAGDTTVNTMQWLLHLLSINLPIQTKISDELQSLPEPNVFECSLLIGSLKETLRLYPVAPFITRFMPETLILDGYEIKANELVLLSLYSSGRNPDYFPRSESFLPERWLRKTQQGYEGVHNSNAFLPFALGSRSCVGKKLAETQILVALSKILRNFKVTSPRPEKLDMVLHLISVPARPVEIKLEPRKQNRL